MDQWKIGLIQRMHSARLHIWQPFYVPVWITSWSEKNFLLACQIWSTAIVTEAPALDSSTLSQDYSSQPNNPLNSLGFGSSLHNLVTMADMLRFLDSSRIKNSSSIRVTEVRKTLPSEKKISSNSTVIGLSRKFICIQKLYSSINNTMGWR